jgi:hypothetical protein
MEIRREYNEQKIEFDGNSFSDDNGYSNVCNVYTDSARCRATPN